MRLWDGTEIIKPIVDRGISQWSVMAEDLDQESATLIARVEEALATTPWGTGAEGNAFYNAHFRDDGPNQMLTQCAQLAKEIIDAGDRVRQSVDNTLQTDADMTAQFRAMWPGQG
ncbi:hypothetical protein ABZ897_07230 [Nonomuraea sp. NPDC046802]|uniref:hypothetical protein n=1 Tax=Nonomuraea sp. NPDC046802 TaxID=3154919 RepID=UPI0033D6FAB3